MPFIKPSVQQGASSNQASGVAEDVMDMIRKQIQGGTFGEGFGPLQREAGTSARQFVNSGGGQFDTSEGYRSMEALHNKKVEDGAAGLREAFAGIGGRFGTGLAKAEGDYRASETADFGGKIAEIERQEFSAQQDRLLQGIQTLFGMGQANTQPAFDMAKQGVVTPDTIVGDSPMSQFFGILKGGLDLFGGFKDIFGNKEPGDFNPNLPKPTPGLADPKNLGGTIRGGTGDKLFPAF